MKILTNDGIDPIGKQLLEEAGHTVDNLHLNPEELIKNIHAYDALTVRSATKVTQEVIDAGTRLKLIGRGGVGLDNIDLAYAKSKGIAVFNTPLASSQSVAELVFAHLLSGVRCLYNAQRHMPGEGRTAFAQLKKACSEGTELRGKTLGVVGFGRIGQEVARIGLGMGMQVVVSDPQSVPDTLTLSFAGGIVVELPVQNLPLAELYRSADFISFHVPFTDRPLLGPGDFDLLKPGVGLVNTARGGVIDELGLVAALDRGQVRFAGLDVFENEPTPRQELLSHPRVSLSPHIGAATAEAQERVGRELAMRIIGYLESFQPEGVAAAELAGQT